MNRNRYFTGKYMTARDFRAEQDYALSRHRLHQRLLHGWGVVCGLRVARHRSPECADRWVVVSSGVAIDCCGREIVLAKDTPFELPLPENHDAQAEEGQSDATQGPPESQQAQTKRRQKPADAHQGPPVEPERPPESLLLCIWYAEEDIELVPVLYDEACDPTKREANRVRETARLGVCRLDEVDPTCWASPGGRPGSECLDDCDEEVPGPGRVCLEPVCPCGQAVPLALVTPGAEGPLHIDMAGRRHLAPPPEYLTHITDINWPHGGEVTLDDLASMGGRLEVRFDRRLLPSEGDATGVNEFTFLVQYGNIERNVEFLPSDRDHFPTLEDECVAVFTMDPGYIDPKGRSNISWSSVYVTLKCDFLLDCHEYPVDGDHLRGRLPSGNGTAGGVFESWFRVVAGGRGKGA